MGNTRRFASKAKYEAWLRYAKWKHPEPSEHPVNVVIAGHPHKVNHCPHCHLTGSKCGEHCR
jgi:hypothetical protein